MDLRQGKEKIRTTVVEKTHRGGSAFGGGEQERGGNGGSRERLKVKFPRKRTGSFREERRKKTKVKCLTKK